MHASLDWEAVAREGREMIWAKASDALGVPPACDAHVGLGGVCAEDMTVMTNVLVSDEYICVT